MNPEFGAMVTVWADKAEQKSEEVLRAIAEDALARVKELTPVRTGHLRASWSIVLGGEAEYSGNELAGAAGSVAGNYAASRVSTSIGGAAASKVGGAAFGAAGTFIGANAAGGQMTIREAIGSAVGELGGRAAGAYIGTAIAPGIGTIVGGFLGGVAGSFGGAAIAGTTVTPKLGQMLIITNSAPYAAAVEYGRQIKKKDGTVTAVEGKHMLAQTVAEMPKIAAAATQRVTAKND